MAMNNEESSDMSVTLQTGMPSGTYCDVISGELSSDGSSCSGGEVSVDGSGTTYVSLSASAEDPFMAIHASECHQTAGINVTARHRQLHSNLVMLESAMTTIY